MRISLSVWVAAALLVAGCGQRSGRSAGPDAAPLRDFPAVQVPGIYNDPTDRQAYVTEHFWDRFFSGAEGFRCDSVTVCGVSRAQLEEAFSTYATLLGAQDLLAARKNVLGLFDKVETLQRADTLSNVYKAFGDLMAHYLYDPNSPFRNEDIYHPYVERMADSPLTDGSRAPAAAYDARMSALNAAGTPAADFRFTDAAGRSRRLYDVRADYTLLFFSNPGCEACKEIVTTLSRMPGVSKMVSSGRLAVVNVYIDEDLASWREHLSDYPKEWYNGYDPSYTIRQDVLYNVRAIPSLYVLDAEKRVILKDAPEERVFAFLDSIRRD
jgi:hypothetical protein